MMTEQTVFTLEVYVVDEYPSGRVTIIVVTGADYQ